ncbi:MAG: M20 family metallopeptidase [Dehalococcoidia bacterium]|nr:M20 family metallopeptidase [Dehalococcoidia bacterium]
MTIEDFKRSATEDVDVQRLDLVALSLRIHANPELAFHEQKASGWLTDYLRRNGFHVEQGICDLPTAFRASFGSGSPVIGIIGEYDALPGVGHACGHNLIGTSAVGAAVALKRCLGKLGGRVVVLGTPGEEAGGGKVTMVKKGAFAGLDVAMIVHPGVRNNVYAKALACIGLDVDYIGRSAHAAARPEAGINALDALILAYNGIGALRQHIRGDARIHGIITHGGDAANVIPAHASASFLVRAADERYLLELQEKVQNCFLGAATATGTEVKLSWGANMYAALRTNVILAQAFAANMEALGRKVEPNRRPRGMGSTDMGNVSAVVPSIHPSVAIAHRTVVVHSPDFAAAAASEEGQCGLIDAAKAMAMTAVDLLASPSLLASVKEEFLAMHDESGGGDHVRL